MPPTSAENRKARDERRHRALDEPLDVVPRPGYGFPTFEVRNARRKTRYTVLVPAFPDRDGALCGCPDFGRRGLGTCKHLEAVALFIDEHPEVGREFPEGPSSSDPLWTEVDRRSNALAKERTVGMRMIRNLGAVLIGR